MAREFPIANGKLVTDLDANGFKILNAKGGGGGGSGGTTDYNDLNNKPKINDVEVSGSKSAEDYGLATKKDLNDYLRKEKDGGLVLSQKFDEYGSTIPCLLKVTDSVVLGQPSDAGGDEALLDMKVAGRSGGFRVFVGPHFNDDGSETETSQTVVSIDDIPDVGLELRKMSAKRDKADNIAVTPSYSSKWNVSYDIHSDSEELKAKLELWFRNTPTSISGSDSEGWNWNNLPVIEGYYNEGVYEIEGAYARTSYASDTDLFGFSIIGQRPVVVTPGEPYVTPTGVKALAIPKYEFVTATIADGKVTVAPYTNAKLESDGTAFTVVVAEGDGKTRDCVLRVECGNTVPTITWPTNFHPRTDAETDFACVAGVRNVYWISEYSEGEFCVAGWQETTGGNVA